MSRVGSLADGNFVISVAKSQMEASKRLNRQSRPPGTEDMDPDYREYFRPRGGEFLTRGAALASAQLIAGECATPVGSTRGSLASHLDIISATNNPGLIVPRVSSQATSGVINTVSMSRLQVAAGKEKYGERRNPTILRKKLDLCVYLMSSIGIKMEVEDGTSVTCAELVGTLIEQEDVNLPRQATEIFSLWMTSPLLEVQLKPHHKPFYIRREWNHFLQRFSSALLEKKTLDEPILSFQRNIFLHKKDEVKIRESKILELLYEEAKYNILFGRYPCEISDYIM